MGENMQELAERLRRVEDGLFGLTEYLLRCTFDLPDRCGEDSCLKTLGEIECPFRQKGPIQAFRRWYKDDRQS